MKLIHIILILLTIAACNPSEANSNIPNSVNSVPVVHNLNNETGQSYRTHHFRDARTGLVVNSAEYPASWNVISKPIYTLDQKFPTFLIQIEGPNHLHSFNTPIKPFISYQNAQTYQFMANAMYANLHKPLMSNQEILQTEVQDRMERSGFTFSGNHRLAKIENYLRQKIAEQGGNAHLDMLATVWQHHDGRKAIVSITKIAMQQSLANLDIMTLWFYSVDYTFVDAHKLEETIQQLEQTTITSKDNPEWKQYVNLLIQQRARESAIRHQQNMANRNALFEAHQKKMQGIWAAQDANHASFMNRNFGSGSSTSQRNFVNMINEEETVYNPLTQENYQVKAGSLEYWMDSDGNLIQNNDLFYTPNGDINLNNREWVRVK